MRHPLAGFQNRTSLGSRLAAPVGAALLLLCIWWLAALFKGSTYLPGPEAVFREAFGLVVSGEFLRHFIATLGRIAGGFCLALLGGGLVACLMRGNEFLTRFFQFQVTLGLTIPSLAWSVIAIMAFGLTNAAAIFTAVAVTTPIVTTTLFEGIKSLDRDLTEVSDVYRLDWRNHLRLIVFPQLLPYLFAAGRTGIGLAWKTVVITEAFGLTDGLGYQIAYSFSLLSMRGVLAWTLLFTVAMMAVEYWLLQRVERRLFLWKPQAESLP